MTKLEELKNGYADAALRWMSALVAYTSLMRNGFIDATNNRPRTRQCNPASYLHVSISKLYICKTYQNARKCVDKCKKTEEI